MLPSTVKEQFWRLSPALAAALPPPARATLTGPLEKRRNRFETNKTGFRDEAAGRWLAAPEMAQRPTSTSSDGSAVLVASADELRQCIDGAGATQLDEDEDAMLSALLGSDAGEGAGDAVACAPNANEFVRVWESDMQAYLAR